MKRYFLLFAVAVFVLGMSFSADAQYSMAESSGDASLPVTLSSFTANAKDGEVTLRWRTETEVDNLGFYIYHSESKDGPFVRVNDSMIPSAGNSPHEYKSLSSLVHGLVVSTPEVVAVWVRKAGLS